MASETVVERSGNKDASNNGAKNSSRGGPIARVSRFIREVVAELRKVIWPTRAQLITYTGVVLVFLVIMTTIIASLDFGLGKAVLWVFGKPDSASGG